jgi:hypothetical protein
MVKGSVNCAWHFRNLFLQDPHVWRTRSLKQPNLCLSSLRCAIYLKDLHLSRYIRIINSNCLGKNLYRIDSSNDVLRGDLEDAAELMDYRECFCFL